MAVFTLCATSALAQSTTMPAKAPAATTQSDDGRWEATFNSEMRYFSWSSSQIYPPAALVFPKSPSSGQSVYNPFGLEVKGRPNNDWEIDSIIRSAYVWSTQTSGGITGSYSGTTDTSVGTTVTYSGITGIQPFVSLNVNIPTGQTVLKGNSAFARPDYDVVGIPGFGEGLNYGVTSGFNLPITKQIVLSAGLGYTNRGTFDREGVVGGLVQPNGIVDPGDVWTPNVSASYRGERLSLSASASFSQETTTRLNNVDYYKAGDRVFAAAGAGYAWDQNWASRLTGSASHYQSNKVLNAFGLPPLVLEPFNTNSDVFTVDFDTMYSNNGFSIGPTLGYLYRDHNGYDPVNFAFLPAKTKYSAGLSAQYAFAQRGSINIHVERMWLHEGPKPLFYPDVGTDAWLATVGGVIRF
jgi:hypothetical protein